MSQDSLDTTKFIKAIKGRVTVELFDAKSGDLVEQRRDNNFIALIGVAYLQSIQRSNFKSTMESLYTGSDTDLAITSPFQNVSLSNYTGSADQTKERIMPGTPIGYANKTAYSGSDTMRGTPNALLCTTSETLTKWVFDWPTHAANGTIGSIGWTVNNLIFSTIVKSTANLTQYPAANSIYVAYLPPDKIIVGNGTNVKVFNRSDFSEAASFTTISANGIAWDSVNSKVWVISGNQIASYNQTGTVVNSPMTVTTRTYKGLTFDGTDLWTTNGSVLYKISTSGSDITSYTNTLTTETGSGYGQYITDVAWDSRAQKLRILHVAYRAGGYSNYYRLVSLGDIISGALTSYHVLFPTVVDSTPYRCFDIDPDNQDILVRFNSTNIDARIIDGLGTLVVLPSSVTKTNAQTLRVTYQLDYN